MIRIIGVLTLALTYVLLTGNWQISNIIIGLLIGLIIIALLRPPKGSLEWRNIPRTILALAAYVFIMIRDVILSGLQVARLVLDPKLPIRPGIIAIPSQCESELATALSAHAITLAPGEMVIEIDENGVMYTHTLDITKAEAYVNEAQRLRSDLLGKIFV
ncbi:MAG: Na+/H+ antiporter subunit E [Caldilineales bacterium]|nr:Na+/H+ antiporter subunit E [Caldilineales bacterium]